MENIKTFLRRLRVTSIPEWEKPCWLYALTFTLGLSDKRVKEVIRKNGWDGVSHGASVATVLGAVWDLTGQKPNLEGTREASKLTARQFSATRPAGKGLVFTKGHVMPWVNGQVSNFNGHGEEQVTVICTLS